MTITMINNQIACLNDSIPAAERELAYQRKQLTSAKTEKQIAACTRKVIAARASLNSLKRAKSNAESEKKSMLRVAS